MYVTMCSFILTSWKFFQNLVYYVIRGHSNNILIGLQYIISKRRERNLWDVSDTSATYCRVLKLRIYLQMSGKGCTVLTVIFCKTLWNVNVVFNYKEMTGHSMRADKWNMPEKTDHTAGYNHCNKCCSLFDNYRNSDASYNRICVNKLKVHELCAERLSTKFYHMIIQLIMI